MALLGRFLASFQAAAPVPSLTPLDGEFNQLTGANGALNGGSSTNRILTKYTHATEPVLELDQLGAGTILQLKQNGVEKFRVENDGDIVGNGLTGAAGVYTFGGTPVGPASDPTTDNQLARKAFVDTRRTRWAASFWIADVAARGVDVTADNIQKALIPGSNFTATHIFIVATSGVNAGQFIVQIIKAPFSGAAGTLLGSLSYDPGTGSLLNVGQEIDIADHAFTANDFVQANISAVAGAQQKSVIVGVRGFQTPQNP